VTGRPVSSGNRATRIQEIHSKTGSAGQPGTPSGGYAGGGHTFSGDRGHRPTDAVEKGFGGAGCGHRQSPDYGPALGWAQFSGTQSAPARSGAGGAWFSGFSPRRGGVQH